MRTATPFPALFLAPLLAALMLAGCSAEPPAPTPAAAIAASQDATIRIGDVTVRATVMPTANLGKLVAEKYGIQRDDKRVMLLVGLRRGADAEASSVPARITATATDLRGQRQPIELRELHSGELLDYVGTVPVTLPDTVRFDLDITLEDGARSTMQLIREFHP